MRMTKFYQFPISLAQTQFQCTEFKQVEHPSADITFKLKVKLSKIQLSTRKFLVEFFSAQSLNFKRFRCYCAQTINVRRRKQLVRTRF